MNKLPDSTRRLMGNRKRSRKYLFLVVFFIILCFPGYFLYQYTIGYVGAETGSSIFSARSSFFSWLDKTLGRKDVSVETQINAKLLQENASLKEQMRIGSIKFENDDLRIAYRLQEVKVIGNDNFLDTPMLFLLGGSDNGLKTGLPVVDETGIMVGTVKRCQQKISEMVLMPNHESRVGARIAGTEWNGVMKGNRDLRAVLEMLPLDSQPKEGDQVVTDNRNPDVPAGIIIGTIESVNESDDHLFKEALINLPYDSKKLDKVWVVIGRK